MRRKPEEPTIDRLGAEFEALQARLTRVANALVLVESRRARVLTKMAHDETADARELLEQARQARVHADLAVSILSRAALLDPAMTQEPTTGERWLAVVQ